MKTLSIAAAAGLLAIAAAGGVTASPAQAGQTLSYDVTFHDTVSPPRPTTSVWATDSSLDFYVLLQDGKQVGLAERALHHHQH